KPLTVEEFAVCLMDVGIIHDVGAIHELPLQNPKEVISRAQAADIVMRLLTAP
ncbi:MAG: hypothetical protein XD68_1555, partial [Synergistales bacterium 54_24]